MGQVVDQLKAHAQVEPKGQRQRVTNAVAAEPPLLLQPWAKVGGEPAPESWGPGNQRYGAAWPG